jgi:hypothetical protein
MPSRKSGDDREILDFHVVEHYEIHDLSWMIIVILSDNYNCCFSAGIHDERENIDVI